MINEGSTVTVEYTVSDENGTIIDTSRDKEMLTFTIGEKVIFPDAEKSLLGRNISEHIETWLEAERAFGEYDPDLVMKIPRINFGEITEIKKGMQLKAESVNGSVPLTVIDYDNTAVTVDANHPFAGKRIKFEFFIVDVK